jgi:putative colanic acid biosynthesis acetyltransferase WcaF
MIDLSEYDVRGFDRGAPAWKESLWIVCKSLFFLPGWPLPSGFRAALLRFFGARIGRGFVIRSGVNLTFPWRFAAGDHVWIGEEALVLCLDRVEIGSNVCISQRAFLCTGSHDYRTEDFPLVTKPIRVEDGVWIAAQAFVGPGVVIGAGSVVAAGAVVMRSVEPNVLVRGNPAEGEKIISMNA